MSAGAGPILVVAPDLGERYLDTLYDDEWVARTLGDDALTDLPDAPHR